MPVPRLIHPVWVQIEAVDKPHTPFDADLRQPIRTVRRSAVRIPAQVRIRALSEPEYEATGLDEDVEGWLTVRVLDCARKSYTPKVGDRLVAVGKRTVEYYLRMIQDEGHYGSAGGATLMRLYFEDRRPATSAPRLN